MHPKKRAHEAHLVDRNHRAEARQNREEEPRRCDQRHQNRTEHQNQHNKRQAHHHRKIQRQFLRQRIGDVDIAAGQAGHTQFHVSALYVHVNLTQLLNQVHGFNRARPVFGDHLENLHGVVISLPGGNHGFHVVGVFRLNRVSNIDLRLLSLRLAHPCGGVCHRQHGAAHTLTELILHQFVRLVLCALNRRACSRRQAHAHLAHRNGNSTQHQHTGNNGQHRAGEHNFQPAVRGFLTLLLVSTAGRDFLRGADRLPRLFR